jgi:tRNA G18 (ribose-2'-O)-methylase SpoU
MEVKKLTMEELGRPDAPTFAQQPKVPLVLVLDNIRSGLNVGSLFRTADAFALEGMVLCGITAQPPHREILKTALGSSDTVAWQTFESTPRALEYLREQGYAVWALEQSTPKIWLNEVTWPDLSKVALVLGNEVDGVSEEALALCDAAVEIPQYGTKHSLNVAVAGGIACWELVKCWRLNANAKVNS